jgi:AcrR family transcriptional regulator
MSTRRYDSPRRREQAAATRRDNLDAAQRLFERDGYAATTMAAIAQDAGVASKTVYLAFETKSGVLRALWNLRLRGDLDPAAVGERDWYREVLDEPDRERRLRLNARNSRAVKERAGALLEVIRAAAAADPDIRALWERINDEFYANQLAVAGDAADADVLWTLNHPDVWQLLVARRGWTPARYERWLAEASLALLGA